MSTAHNESAQQENEMSQLIIGKMPDFTRPVLFLDFDGVINMGGHYTPPAGETRHIVHKWRGIPHKGEWENFICDRIHVSFYEEIVDALRDMNCVWISSWKNLTQTKLNPMLGFDFGYVDWKYRGLSDWGMYGKAEGVSQVVNAAGGCEWIVIDDDMAAMKEVIELETGISGIVIAPDSEYGLTLDECTKIQDLCAE